MYVYCLGTGFFTDGTDFLIQITTPAIQICLMTARSHAGSHHAGPDPTRTQLLFDIPDPNWAKKHRPNQCHSYINELMLICKICVLPKVISLVRAHTINPSFPFKAFR